MKILMRCMASFMHRAGLVKHCRGHKVSMHKHVVMLNLCTHAHTAAWGAVHLLGRADCDSHRWRAGCSRYAGIIVEIFAVSYAGALTETGVLTVLLWRLLGCGAIGTAPADKSKGAEQSSRSWQGTEGVLHPPGLVCQSLTAEKEVIWLQHGKEALLVSPGAPISN